MAMFDFLFGIGMAHGFWTSCDRFRFVEIVNSTMLTD